VSFAPQESVVEPSKALLNECCFLHSSNPSLSVEPSNIFTTSALKEMREDYCALSHREQNDKSSHTIVFIHRPLEKSSSKTATLKETTRHNKTWIGLGHLPFSPPSNLTLGKRRHPSHQQVETDDHTPHDPKTLRIVRAVESEQDGENDTSKIAHGAHSAAENTVGMRVDVWDESEIGSVVSVLATKGDSRREESHTHYQLPRRTPCQRSARTLWFHLVG
jgi:hypothetical protein